MHPDIARVLARSPSSPLGSDAAWDVVGRIYWGALGAEDMRALLSAWNWTPTAIEAFTVSALDHVDKDDPQGYRFTRDFNVLSALKHLFEVGNFRDQSPATLRLLEVLGEPVGRSIMWVYGLVGAVVASTAVSEPTLVRLVRATSNMHVVGDAIRHPNASKAVAREALLIDNSKNSIARHILDWRPCWDDPTLLRDVLWYHREYERPSDKLYARRMRERLGDCAPHELPTLLVAYAAFSVERAANYLRLMSKRRVLSVPAANWADLLGASSGNVSLAPLRTQAILAMSHAAEAPRAKRRAAKTDGPAADPKLPGRG